MRHFLTSLTLLSALTLHAQPPSYVPTDGLVGWWPFNGNANDESGNGNNGVVNGATLTQDRFNNAASAYDFTSASNTINFGNNPELGLTNNTSITLSFWSKLPQSGAVCTIYKYDNGNSNNSNYAVFPTSNSVAATGNGTGSNTNYVGLQSNTWIHVAISYSSGLNNTKIYINGILSQQGTQNLANSVSSANLAINSALGIQNYQRGTGQFDDFGIWNRALTPAEIQALYNAQDGPCVSPTAVSFSGLSTSYTTSDGPATLTGTPDGGVFIGPGVNGNTFSPAVAGEGTHGIIYTNVDDNGCVNSFSLCTSVSLGMGLEPGGNAPGGVRVFPNPNRGQFTVELELAGLVGLQVFDARGALVHNEVFTASGSRTQRTLDLSAFAKGSYTLLVEHDGQRVSQAVVVE
jgi:hypothetical protein